MSDEVKIAIITAMGSIVTAALAGYAAYMMAKLNLRLKENAVSLKENAVKVEEVQVALAENSEKTTATLTLVDGRMGKILEELAGVRRDYANVTGNPAHIDAAVQAESEAIHHQSLEKTVEVQSGVDAENRD